MNIRTVPIAAFALLFITACSAGPTAKTDETMVNKGTSEKKSSLTFVGGSSIVDHPGGFTDFTVNVGNSVDLENSTVTATIVMTSLFTDSDRLTGHLQTEEFFNTEVYPEALFSSTEVIKNSDGYRITGDLTVKGVTKSITMNATLVDNLFTASFDLPRKEFGIGNDAYGEKILDVLIPVKAVVYIQ